MLTLYYSPHSCSLAPYIALEEAGATFTPYRMDFAAGEQNGAAYRKLNPKGRVPALATDHGVLSENVAILTYIAQTFPAANLAPTDLFQLAQMQAFNAYHHLVQLYADANVRMRVCSMVMIDGR